MNKTTLALLFAAGALIAGCKSNEAKPEEKAAEPAPAAQQAPAPAPAKPECPPPETKKKTTSKSKTAKKSEPPPEDCEPAKPKSAATAKAAEPAKPAPAPAAATVAGSTVGKTCNPCAMKSKDGTFEGEVYGTIPAGSKWARLQIGMHQSEVERILGVTSNIRAYVTAKAWIPFYFGGDSHRYEAVYAGQGSVAYTGGSFGGGQGILMMINFDPKIQ